MEESKQVGVTNETQEKCVASRLFVSRLVVGLSRAHHWCSIPAVTTDHVGQEIEDKPNAKKHIFVILW